MLVKTMSLDSTVGDFVEEESAAGLSDGFDHEDAGHDGVAGEMALEELFVEGDVLEGDDALACFISMTRSMRRKG